MIRPDIVERTHDLEKKLSLEDRLRISGVQITVEAGQPLTVDLIIQDGGNWPKRQRWQLTEQGWVERR